MDGVKLADRLAYGAGCAARRVGFAHDAFRPGGREMPLDPAWRFLRLSVAYALPGGAVNAPAGFAAPFRQAWADWSYLRPGDYLAGPEGVAFVAAIEPPKPLLVVMTNAVITLARMAAPALAGLNPYGASARSSESVLVRGFPASLLLGGGADRAKAGLPDDVRLPGFTALLPVVAGVQPSIDDVLLDEAGGRFVLTAVETVGAVWRLSLLQAVS
jgi:hypothetical protein